MDVGELDLHLANLVGNSNEELSDGEHFEEDERTEIKVQS